MSLVPASRPSHVDLAGLAWTLVRTDFKVRYHGTFMGFFWALLKPTAMFLVLMAVFSFIFAQDPNYKLNLILGLFLWDFFAESTKLGVTALAAKGYLLAKTHFPRWLLVVTAASNPLLTLIVVCTAIVITLTAIGRAPSPAALALFGVCLLALVTMVLGFSLGASVLFLRYRDLNQIWDVMVQAGFFLAPVVYPLSILPERFHFYLYLWPPTPVIQFSRTLLVDRHLPTGKAFLMLAGVTAFILTTGIALFRRYSPAAAEHL
ncbi:MAG: ABC transporter permease [Polyangia bacterium]